MYLASSSRRRFSNLLSQELRVHSILLNARMERRDDVPSVIPRTNEPTRISDGTADSENRFIEKTSARNANVNDVSENAFSDIIFLLLSDEVVHALLFMQTK
jgi:hypothetical protein